MKKFTLAKVILLSVSLAAISSAVYYFGTQKQSTFLGRSENELEERYNNPAARAAYEFDMIKNPQTGRIPEGTFEAEMAQARQIYAQQVASKVESVNTYTFAGPNNLGGRTRSVVYDVRFNGTSNQVIMAGGVSGGIFKSTDNGATWTRKSPTNQLYSVTSIAQDTRAGQENTWYYATGESIGNSASIDFPSYYLGHGIFKSTDNGETWTRLTASNPGSLEGFNRREDLVSKVMVDPATGNVYMCAMDGIYRSTDGGTTWGIVLNSGANSIVSNWMTDIVCNSTGTRFYAAFSGTHPYPGHPSIAATTNVPGVWTSTTGAPGTWTKIAGDGAATNPAGWDANLQYGRVVLAIPPSDENLLYALYDDGDGAAVETELYRWNQSGGAWTDLSANLPAGSDPIRTQGGYNLIIAVKPDDANVIFLGGTNLYRSTDGFTSTANTQRIGGYGLAAGTSAIYPNSHPDIHAIAFQPGTPLTMICGNDGGIQRTTNCLANATTTIAMPWTDISTGFRTYQFYYVALEPVNASSKAWGGAQDNGTVRNSGGSGVNFERMLPGDGVSVGLSRNIGGTFWEWGGSQNGSIYRRPSTFGVDQGFSVRPTGATDAGLFVTLFHLDPDNTDTLYYASDSSLYRTTSASTVTSGAWTQMTGVHSIVDGTSPKTRITALATTRGAYNAATASLFIGTNEGRIYRLDNPAVAAPATAPVNITGAGMPTGATSTTNSYISSIAVNPRNDDTVIVTYSSYGVNSVFWTGNANSATPTWVNVEGNLTLPSYRSSAIAVTNNGVEYFVGTSVGLYRATINGASPGTTTWSQEGATEIGNAVVSHLVLRPIDNRLLVGTHGYGMWATTLTGAGLPVNFTSFTGKVEDKRNVLQWKVENEVDNKGYEIERKYKNESSFTKIGFVAAKSANAAVNEYTFPDGLVDLGVDNVSYRLKQIDIDGDFQYSTTVTLTRKVSAKFVEYITVRPSSLFIRMNGQSNQPLNFRLFDNSGKLVQQRQLQQRTQEVSLVGLSRGVFIVELSSNDGRRHSQKVVY
jgi:hypothetical protein